MPLEGVSEGVSEYRGGALGGDVGAGLGHLGSRREAPRAEDLAREPNGLPGA